MPTDSGNPSEAPAAAVSPERWVDDHANPLFRYAMARLGNRAAAEDLVQETFLAALKSRDRFGGRSSERTWLTSILKHKLIDYLRKNSRQILLDDPESLEVAESRHFQKDGHWKTKPSDWWAHPDKSYERKEFWAVFQKCLSGLKAPHRQAFALRELEDMEARDICRELGISEANLWVMLHRSRLRLRECLEVNWFGAEKRSTP